MKRFLIAVLALGLFGCAVPQPKVVERLPFPAAEYAALAKTGTGVVTGQLFARQRGGGVVKGAGSVVYLNPVTSLSQQWYDETKKGNVLRDADVDPRYAAVGHVTKADADGRFHFEAVPPGDYFVTGAVSWEAPTQFGMAVQGGRAVERITVANDQTVDVMLVP